MPRQSKDSSSGFGKNKGGKPAPRKANAKKAPALKENPFKKFFRPQDLEQPETPSPFKNRRPSSRSIDKPLLEKKSVLSKNDNFIPKKSTSESIEKTSKPKSLFDKDHFAGDRKSSNTQETVRKPSKSSFNTGRKFSDRFDDDRSSTESRPPIKKNSNTTAIEKSQNEITRLNKYVAQSGLCSRRKAADLIKAGEVYVNGTKELNPAYEVQNKDIITHKSKQLKKPEKHLYILMNKPKNVITTNDDEKGRKTVLDLIKNRYEERLYPVGRLDRNTTGLLLLTNDGDLAKKLSHPSHMVKKFYHVELDRNIRPADIEKIKAGIELEDGVAEVDAIDYIEGGKKNEIGIEIHIGKNRIVRRIFEALKYEVVKLDRTYYAGLTKKDLPRGFTRELDDREIIMLKHFTNQRKK